MDLRGADAYSSSSPSCSSSALPLAAEVEAAACGGPIADKVKKVSTFAASKSTGGSEDEVGGGIASALVPRLPRLRALGALLVEAREERGVTAARANREAFSAGVVLATTELELLGRVLFSPLLLNLKRPKKLFVMDFVVAAGAA